MNIQHTLLILMLSSSVSGCQLDQNASNQYKANDVEQIQTQIAQKFDDLDSKGIILFLKDGKRLSLGNQPKRAEQSFIPASTFKILNALIALEHNKTTTTEIFEWNGQPRAYPHWQKNMTMVEAMQLSTVPVYQQIAKRIGLPLMQSELSRVGYGNKNIGNIIDRFWLDGPLEITPTQSLDFITKLSDKALPFKPEVQQAVQDMLLIETHPTFKLYGKTGWGTSQSHDVGWIVGWIETTQGKKIPYVLNMQMKNGMDPNVRKELVLFAKQLLKL